jgi:hypothetical protein
MAAMSDDEKWFGKKSTHVQRNPNSGKNLDKHQHQEEPV